MPPSCTGPSLAAPGPVSHFLISSAPVSKPANHSSYLVRDCTAAAETCTRAPNALRSPLRPGCEPVQVLYDARSTRLALSDAILPCETIAGTP